MKIKKETLEIVLFYFFLFAIISEHGFIKYIITMLFSISMLMRTIEVKNLYILMPGVTYLIIGFFCNVLSGYADYFTVKYALLIMAPSLAALGIYYAFGETKADVCDLTFWALAIYNMRDIPRFTLADWLESSYAFTYGLYALYFLLGKKWNRAILALALFLLAHKRIALFGILTCSLFMLLVNQAVEKDAEKVRRIYVVSTIAVVILSYAFILFLLNGRLVTFLWSHHIHLMGRDYIWGAFRSFSDFKLSFIGRGVGFVLSKLEFFQLNASSKNLHSDLYAAYLELGFVGFGIWLMSYFYFIGKFIKAHKNGSRALVFVLITLIYTFIMYTTDNIFIYIIYWLPLNLMFLEVSNKRLFDSESDEAGKKSGQTALRPASDYQHLR